MGLQIRAFPKNNPPIKVSIFRASLTFVIAEDVPSSLWKFHRNVELNRTDMPRGPFRLNPGDLLNVPIAESKLIAKFR